MAYRLTHNQMYRDQAWAIFEAFDKHCRLSSGGFATIRDVDEVPTVHEDRMETFWIVSVISLTKAVEYIDHRANVTGRESQISLLDLLWPRGRAARSVRSQHGSAHLATIRAGRYTINSCVQAWTMFRKVCFERMLGTSSSNFVTFNVSLGRCDV